MLTVADAQRRIAAGDLTAVELTETMLDRIARVDADLNAYLHVDAESALEQARAADRRRDRPPLLGVPVCVKDVIDVAGMPTTAGAAGWHRSPERDAVVVARLRAAGAVIVGKGNTNEFAYGADGLNPHRGDCRNPHDRSRITGGSSSGPAAATAAGTALAAVGTDTSGSIRVPASLCGLVGVRPTMGRVPRAGVLPLAPSYDAVGPLARTVEDAAILLGVLAGADVADSLDTGVRGLRLGVVETLVDAAEPYVAGGIASAAAHLESLGAELVPLRLERLRDAAAIHRVVPAVRGGAGPPAVVRLPA